MSAYTRSRFAEATGRRASVLLALFAVLALATACAPGPQYKRVQLGVPGQALAASTTGSTRAPLRVAVASMVSPKETFKTYQDLLQYLGARLDRPVELVQRKTYAEVNDLVRTGGIDLAFVCSQAYVEGQQDFGMELLAAPQVRGQTVYYSYVIVPADSPASQFDDLRDKVFAFTDPDSNTGRLVPTYLLQQRGLTPEDFFRKVVYTYSHDNSVKAVADKLVDGAAVDSLVYDYTVARDPALAARTRVILRSEPFGAPPVVVNPALAPDLKSRLREAILGMHEDPRGRDILDGLMIDRFVVPDQSSYEPIREMLRRVRGLR